MVNRLVVYIQRLERCCTLNLARCTSLIRAVLTSLEEWCRGFQCKRWRDSNWRGRQRRGDGAPSRTLERGRSQNVQSLLVHCNILILITSLTVSPRELDIYSLAQHLCKMWIFYEPRRVTLGITWHFVEE